MKEIISGITSPVSAGDSEPTNAANFSITDIGLPSYVVGLRLAIWATEFGVTARDGIIRSHEAIAALLADHRNARTFQLLQSLALFCVPASAFRAPVPCHGSSRCLRLRSAATLAEFRPMPDAEVFLNRDAFEIADRIVAAIVVPVMDVIAGRDRAAMIFPDCVIQLHALALEIHAAAVVPNAVELLNGRADDSRPHAVLLL
jgi:hypothetical protein